MAKFDYERFTGFKGDWTFAVSKERYTLEQAEEIAKRELGFKQPIICDMYVRFGFGYEDDGSEIKNCWWLEFRRTKQSVPVWAFAEGWENE
jgi:hypothetical protein